MYALSLSTGEERLLDSSTSPAEEENSPAPSIAWPWVAWYQATDDDYGNAPIRVFDLRDGSSRTVAAVPTAGPLSLEDTTGTVYYEADNGSGGRDVYAVPADGSVPPRRVTTSGLAASPMARNGGVVWRQPLYSDADSLWYEPVTGGKPQQFSKRSEQYGAGDGAFPGRDFVVWSGLEGLMVADPAGGRPAVVLQKRSQGGKDDLVILDTAADWWAEGDRVAWVTRNGYGPEAQSTVHVAVIHT